MHCRDSKARHPGCLHAGRILGRGAPNLADAVPGGDTATAHEGERFGMTGPIPHDDEMGERQSEGGGGEEKRGRGGGESREPNQ